MRAGKVTAPEADCFYVLFFQTSVHCKVIGFEIITVIISQRSPEVLSYLVSRRSLSLEEEDHHLCSFVSIMTFEETY